jgi:predicted lysophospholipase L1 biosynthesis ABC-type transport system permease subunit
VAIVNRTFVRRYFGAGNAVGRQAIVKHWKNVDIPTEIVGVVDDAVYGSVREPVPPTVYVPLQQKEKAALMLRTTGDPLPFAATLRREIGRASANVRVSNVALQSDFVRRQMVLERLIALLSSFFAVVALLLSTIGLYSVLNAAVSLHRREIGIRVALGARAAHVIRRVTGAMVTPVGIGVAVGLGGGVAFGRVVERLLFQIKATEAASLTFPLITLLVAAGCAALPPVIRAIRIDPAETLRSE